MAFRSIGQGEGLFRRLDVRWPFAFRSRLDQPLVEGRGGGDRAPGVAGRLGRRGHPLSAQTPDLRIRGRGIHPFRWTNIDTRYPRPYTPLAAIVAVDSVRIAAGVVTAGEGGRTTGERDAERCKDRAQKNPTANHGCLVLSFLSGAAVIATSLRPLAGRADVAS